MHNETYQSWVDGVGCKPDKVSSIADIPFLPISAFKNYKLGCEIQKEQTVFTSSGTTGSIPSRHFVYDVQTYLRNATQIFESFYGSVRKYCFLALLPSYLERTGSSLVAMVDHFISESEFEESGFYLNEFGLMYDQLKRCREKKIPTILFGVSFGLLDFLDAYTLSFPELIVIETGGMKGRRKEITREELHRKISMGFNVANVHSEYGMTELFSQAYSKGDGLFVPGSTLKVMIKDITDPLTPIQNGRTGIINCIDLANIDSCAFIETQDIGKCYEDGSFEILGRLDVSDIRGCNLMVGDV